jgi:hypothetical protein
VRLGTSAEIRRIDLGPVLDLLPPLRREWAELEFDGTGLVVNPITGQSMEQVTLVQGPHLQAGAVYRVVIRSPRLEVPEHRAAELDDELRRLVDRKAGREEMRRHAGRRREASIVVGTDEAVSRVVLRDDGARRLACTITREGERWTIDAALDDARLARLELSGRIDITAALRSDGLPGCLAGLLGGTGEGRGVIDLSRLEAPGGLLVEADGRANRFAGRGKVNVKASRTRWRVEIRGTVRGKGLGRLALLVARRPIRMGVERRLAELGGSEESWTADLERDIGELRRAIDAAGGAAGFVHRSLWEPGFDPGFPRR